MTFVLGERRESFTSGNSRDLSLIVVEIEDE